MEDIFLDDFEIDDEPITGFDLQAESEDMALDNGDEEFLDEVMNEVHSTSKDPSFGSIYTNSEINKMKEDVSNAEYIMKCRKEDVKLWESKTSLNDTKEHIKNGDYENALRHLDKAKREYQDAKYAFEKAKSKLNNAL